jgi:hypothetical protein
MLTKSGCGRASFLIGVVCLWCCGCQSQVANTSDSSVQKSPSAAQNPTNSELQAWKVPLRSPEELHSLTNLEALMRVFTSTYSRERNSVQISQHTVILFRLSGATLIQNGKIVQTMRVIPSEYHNLRYAAHVPFTVFLMLHPLCGSPLSESSKTNIQNYIALLEGAEPELDSTGLTEAQLIRQHRLFTNAISFLSNSLVSGSVTEDDLKVYARSASIDMDKNMREAGAAQVNGVHQQLLKWRRQMTDEEWRNVHFIIHGPQQPRGGDARTLYLSALLKDPGDGRGYEGEGDRVVYREDDTTPFISAGAHPWDDDLQLLAAIDLDRIASEAFFSDPDRLTVDIVSDGAREQIRRLDFSPLQPIGY